MSMRRDWGAVFKDAEARGLSQVGVARELGVGRQAVHRAQHRLGVVLASGRDHAKRDAEAAWDQRFAATPPATITARDFACRYGVTVVFAHHRARERGLRFKPRSLDEIWERRFAAAAGMRLNDFCRLHGVTYGPATFWANKLGHRFAPSAARALRAVGKQPKRGK